MYLVESRQKNFTNHEYRIKLQAGKKGKKEGANMDSLNSNAMLMMQRSMDFLWSKQSCILDNIANAETPGYKTKYVTFEESLRQAIYSAAEEENQSKISTPQIRQAIEETPVSFHEAQESTRVDDNGVDITEQSVELSRNGYQLQYVLDAINSDFSLLRTVTRG